MRASIGVNMRVTGHYSQGERKHMEDMFSVAYQQTEDENDLEYAYFGIFDGHGGSEAAAYAKDHLMEAIVRQKQFWSERDADVLRAIRNGYMVTHMQMWRELPKWPRAVHGLPSTAGTTASVAFIRRGKIYVGHVGDSAIVLGYQVPGKSEWNAMPLTLDHKPESEAEMKRIYSSGGKVSEKLGVPRVVWNRFIMTKGELRHIEVPFLAIARSLGDHWSYNSNTHEFVVSPEPDVGVVPIDPSKFRCLIFGTDGLWNMITPKSAVELVQQVQQQNEQTAQNSQSPELWQNPSKILVDYAIKRWSSMKAVADNTSVVTVMMDPPGPPRTRPPIPPQINNPTVNSDSKDETIEPIPTTSKCNTTPGLSTERQEPNLKVSKPQQSNAPAPLPPVSNINQHPPVPSVPPSIGNPFYMENEDEERNNAQLEAYFISRFLSKVDITNSLAHVQDEIVKTTQEAIDKSNGQDDVEIIENNPTEDESKDENVSENNHELDKSTASEMSTEDEDKSLTEIDNNSETSDLVEEKESIQINEVSSSSLLEAPKSLKKKPNQIKSGPSDQSARNLRSHDSKITTSKPPIRNVDKKKSESKVPVPISIPKTPQPERSAQKPKFYTPVASQKNVPTNKSKSTDKSIKFQKNEKIEGKKLVKKPDEETATNVRVTRSKDIAAEPKSQPSVNCPKKSEAVKSVGEKKDASENVPRQFRSKKSVPKEQTELLDGSSECFKENIISPQKATPLKLAKRRNVIEKPEVEPKRKRHSRLDKKTQDQIEDVTSSEANKEANIPENKTDDDLKNKRKCNKKAAKPDEVGGEVHSTTLSETEPTPRSLRSKDATSGDKRVLRSNNDPVGTRPVLRLRNSVGVIAAKGLRRKSNWSQMLRHSPRKRHSK